jgi:hypothetical protein
MRRRTAWILALAVLALLASIWSGQWGSVFGTGQSAPRAPRVEPRPDRATTSPLRSRPAVPRRDLFAFGDRSATPVASVESTVATAEPVAAAAPAGGARLVGFVRTPAGTSAALSINAAVELLGPQEESQGYRLLELDEDRARVRLRTPSGEEIEVGLTPR